MSMFTDGELLFLAKHSNKGSFKVSSIPKLLELAIKQGLFVTTSLGRGSTAYVIQTTEEGMYFFGSYLSDYVKDLELEYR